MELTQDWRGFQGTFYPHRRASVSPAALSGPIYLVLDGNAESPAVVSAFAESEDLSDWIGASLDEILSQSGHREILTFSRAEIEKALLACVGTSQFHDQVELLRSLAKPCRHGKGGSRAVSTVPFRRHFLIEGLFGWWSKVLPSSYGLFVRLEGQADQDFLLLIRRGTLEAFHSPGLHSLSREQRAQPNEVIRHLSEKHMVPIQGLFVPATDWAQWTQAASPWGQVARAIRSNRAKLVPFRWGVAFLAATRAFLTV